MQPHMSRDSLCKTERDSSVSSFMGIVLFSKYTESTGGPELTLLWLDFLFHGVSPAPVRKKDKSQRNKKP